MLGLCLIGRDVLFLVHRLATINVASLDVPFDIFSIIVVDPPMVIYMGKDKHESESAMFHRNLMWMELIKAM